MTMEASIVSATRTYPHFSDGRVDYTHERVCFVLNCVVVAGKNILLTKRSNDVIAYPNTINGISGFIDDMTKSIEATAMTELTEEVCAPIDELLRVSISQPFMQIDQSIGREWHVYAVLAEFKQQFEPTINWENKSATWYPISEVSQMDCMPGFLDTFRVALQLKGEGGV